MTLKRHLLNKVVKRPLISYEELTAKSKNLYSLKNEVFVLKEAH